MSNVDLNDPKFEKLIRYHTAAKPHWSFSVKDWPKDRWDPMSNAPWFGRPIIEVRGRTFDGKILEGMHYACGGGDEQPAFDGWFIRWGGDGFTQVHPVEWQPLEVI